MSAFVATIQILRPHNMLAAAACVACGYALSGGTDVGPVAWTVLFTALVTGFGNLINDFYDRDIDRVNKPARPIPSGRLTPRYVARLYWTGSLLTVVAMAALIDGPVLALVLAWQVALYVYARFGKRIFFGGGLLIASIAASAFFAGAVLAGDWRAAIFPGGFAFLLVLGRELIKGAEDVAGDRAAGALTPAVRYGVGPTVRWGVTILMLCLMLVPLPGLTGHYGKIYVFAIELLFAPGVLLAAAIALREPEPMGLSRASSILKLQMFLGIIAFAFVRL
jgi:geranylgeranylglycerol-phosphate geranylgeranyltransferase